MEVFKTLCTVGGSLVTLRDLVGLIGRTNGSEIEFSGGITTVALDSDTVLTDWTLLIALHLAKAVEPSGYHSVFRVREVCHVPTSSTAAIRRLQANNAWSLGRCVGAFIRHGLSIGIICGQTFSAEGAE